METERKSSCGQPISSTLDLGGQYLCMGEDGAFVPETGAALNLACFRLLGNRNLFLEEHGFPRVSTCLAYARFQFGGGHLGKVRFATDIPVGIAGWQGTFTAFVLGADVPA